MTKISPISLESILKECWSKETCYPPIREEWNSENPAFGQCAITSLIIRDYFGGEIFYCKHYHHYWNKLPNGEEIDFTRSQFPKDAKICFDDVQTREYILESESAKKAATNERYITLKQKVQSLINKEK